MESYKGRPQFIIDGLRAADTAEVDVSEFIRTTEQDVERMWARVTEITREIRNADLSALIGKFVGDEQFAAEFKRAERSVRSGRTPPNVL